MPAADTEALIDRLDRVREARGTIELFDGLLAEDVEAVAKALAVHLRHPLAREFREWLAVRGVATPAPPTPAEVAERLGITDLDAHFAEEAKTRARLTSSADEAWKRARQAEAVANAYAAMLVLLVGVAVVGWLAALDALPFRIVPETTVTPDKQKQATPTENRR